MLVLLFGISVQKCENPILEDISECSDEEILKIIDIAFSEEKNILGKGGFGLVAKIIWKGKEAAVKKIKIPRKNENDKSKEIPPSIKKEIDLLVELKGNKAVVEVYKNLHDEKNDLIYIFQEKLFDSSYKNDHFEEETNLLKEILEEKEKQGGLTESDPNTVTKELSLQKEKSLEFKDLDLDELENLQNFVMARDLLNNSIEIGKSIQALHEQGYSHQDIKPENLMAADEAQTKFKLIDLGYTIEFNKEVRGGTLAYFSYSKLLKNVPMKRSEVKPKKEPKTGEDKDINPEKSQNDNVKLKRPQGWIEDKGDEQFDEEGYEEYFAMPFYTLYKDKDGLVFDSEGQVKGNPVATAYQDVYAFALTMSEMTIYSGIFRNLFSGDLSRPSIEDIERILSKSFFEANYYTPLIGLDFVLRNVIFEQKEPSRQITTMEKLVAELEKYKVAWLKRKEAILNKADKLKIGKPKTIQIQQQNLI